MALSLWRARRGSDICKPLKERLSAEWDFSQKFSRNPVQVDLANVGRARVSVQILDEGVGRERGARLSGEIAPPQRSIIPEQAWTSARPQVMEPRIPRRRVADFPVLIIPPSTRPLTIIASPSISTSRRRSEITSPRRIPVVR